MSASAILNLSYFRRLKSKTVHLTLFALLPFIAILSAIFLPRENIFSIHAKTDTLHLTFTDNYLNQWDISNAKVIFDPFDDEQVQLDKVDTYITLEAQTQANIMIAPDYLHITLTHPNSVGTINSHSPSHQQKVSDYLEIFIPKNAHENRILPFDGAVKLGDDVAVGVTKILHSAKVSIIEEQLFRNGRYEAGNYQLEPGDRITFYADEKLKTAATSKGFLVYGIDGLSFTAHGKVKAAVIDRLGSTGYTLKPNFWARIVYDPAIIAITSLIATLFLSLEFFVVIRRILTEDY